MNEQATEAATITWSQFSTWISDPMVMGIVGGLALLYVVGFCSVFARSGFHWALGTLMLIPGVNVVLFLMLCFGPWPNNKELRSLRKLESVMSKAEDRHRRVA
ncbi:MAG: hypothetical protein ACI8X5_001884 [Planctomycetota bacterium]|jgi:hypothetical protein